MDLNVTLTQETQITGEGAEIGVQFKVAPGTGSITIAEGKKGYVQVSFSLNGTTATTIAQEFTGGTGGTIIATATPLPLSGLYYPGTVVTADNINTVIGTPTASIFLGPQV